MISNREGKTKQRWGRAAFGVALTGRGGTCLLALYVRRRWSLGVFMYAPTHMKIQVSYICIYICVYKVWGNLFTQRRLEYHAQEDTGRCQFCWPMKKPSAELNPPPPKETKTPLPLNSTARTCIHFCKKCKSTQRRQGEDKLKLGLARQGGDQEFTRCNP